LVVGESGAFFGEPNGLDGNDAADQRVFSAIDDTHAAPAEFAEDFVPAGFGGCDHFVATDGSETLLLCTMSLISAEVNAPSEPVFRSCYGRG
jgi:hypothetical protein